MRSDMLAINTILSKNLFSKLLVSIYAWLEQNEERPKSDYGGISLKLLTCE